MELHEFIHEAQMEIKRGTADMKHPFRFFSLATSDGGLADQRMVVNRKMQLKPFFLTFFTDSRTKKVSQLQLSTQCHLLFWHPKKKLQIRLQAKASFEDPQRFQVENLKDYNSVEAPGTRTADEIEYKSDFDRTYFLPINLLISSMDVLKLGREQHQRATVNFSESGVAEDPCWIVP